MNSAVARAITAAVDSVWVRIALTALVLAALAVAAP
jgi:hypothetical protein